MDQYVDVFSDKWTKRWKFIAWIRFFFKIFIMICFIIALVALLEGLAPFINGTEEWEEMPFTLSQLEAILSLLVFCYLMRNAMKVL